MNTLLWLGLGFLPHYLKIHHWLLCLLWIILNFLEIKEANHNQPLLVQSRISFIWISDLWTVMVDLLATWSWVIQFLDCPNPLWQSQCHLHCWKFGFPWETASHIIRQKLREGLLSSLAIYQLATSSIKLYHHPSLNHFYLSWTSSIFIVQLMRA